MRRRVRELWVVAAGVLLVAGGLVVVGREAAADDPPRVAAGDTTLRPRDPALRARLEAGERLLWKGPSPQQTLVLSLGPHVLLLERGLRDLDPDVTLRRDGAFLVVEGPATIRRETDRLGSRRLDATTLLSLPWGTPAPSTEAPPVGDSRLQMIEGDASIARGETPDVPVARGEQSALVEKDDAKLNDFAEGKVEVGGSHLTLLEHTSLRVVTIGETSSVVEILGVRLEMTRGTIIEAAFGSLVLNLQQGAAAVSPVGSDTTSLPNIVLTHLDPGTGIRTTTTVRLQAGQELGVSPTGAWTTPNSASPVEIVVTLTVPVFENGVVVGSREITSYQGTTPVGTGPTVPVLVDAIARVMASSNQETIGPLMEAVTHGTSVTDLGLADLVSQHTGDPALVAAMGGVVDALGTSQPDVDGPSGSVSSGGASSDGDTEEEDEVIVYFNGSTSSVPGDGLGGPGAFANNSEETPDSIENERSQNSSGSSTSNTGTVSPASTASFLR